MLISHSFKRGQGSVILRVKIFDSAVTTQAGKTGLTSASAGLIISTIVDNAATPVLYTVTAGNVEGITTLGTYAAPTASKCRFGEVDATNHKGIYELQIADARFSVAAAKSLLISISGPSGAAECDVTIPLTDLDPYSTGMAFFDRAIRSGVTGTIAASSTTTILNTSGVLPVGVDPDQFKGRVLTFDKETTTTALRGQSTVIEASTGVASPVLTVTPLSRAPAAGDTFSIA